MFADETNNVKFPDGRDSCLEFPMTSLNRIPAESGPSRRVAVIGAGAAGTMAAIFAASAGADTLLMERTRDGGRKILISGGGRCNILPAGVDESRFVTDSSPATLRKILRSWPLQDQISFFESELGIRLVEEVETAKLFPHTQRARDVRDGLLAVARQRGARLMMDTTVTDIEPVGRIWRIHRERGASIEADAVVIATGGLSVPRTGSDGTGLRIVERLGHSIHPTYAALTPVTDDAASFAGLSGVSLPVSIVARDGTRSARSSGGFLFTHRGYSGPSVLDVSHVIVRAGTAGRPASLQVQWGSRGPVEWDEQLRADGARTAGSVIRRELPDRLALALLGYTGIDPAQPLAQMRREDRLALVGTLTAGELPWTGDEGYRKAEVTGGGVALGEVRPRTLESRRHPGLFLCGEILDAFGPIGGYNFLWAWATGRAAGIGAADGALSR